ncbi:MAG: hypothetical protein QXM86_01430 [Candidatus Bathyarchaeia archaeon]
MATIEDYVARIEETCGEERHFIVIFKYNKKDEAIAKILKKAETKKSISSVILELAFKNKSFRVYAGGKVIFRNLKDKNELTNILSELLL